MAVNPFHLLTEDGFYLLTEDGLSHLLLEEATSLEHETADPVETPPGFYSLFDPERYKRRKQEDDEPPATRPDVEIVRTAKINTGIVKLKTNAPRLSISDKPFAKLAAQKSKAEALQREYLARIRQADDEWLMMN